MPIREKFSRCRLNRPNWIAKQRASTESLCCGARRFSGSSALQPRRQLCQKPGNRHKKDDECSGKRPIDAHAPPMISSSFFCSCDSLVCRASSCPRSLPLSVIPRYSPPPLSASSTLSICGSGSGRRSGRSSHVHRILPVASERFLRQRHQNKITE